MKILLVDDKKEVLESMSEFLKDELGHDVVTLSDPAMALNLVRAEYFPLIFTDIKMSGTSGLTVLKRIKEMPHGAFMHVVVMTGYGSIKTSVNCIRDGAYDFLNKPLDVEDLEKIVTKSKTDQRQFFNFYEINKNQIPSIETFSRAIKRQYIDNDSFFESITNIIPLALKNPKIACCSLIVNDKEYITDNYTETSIGYKTNIVKDSKVLCEVCIYYLEEMPPEFQKTYFPHEKAHLNLFLEKLSDLIIEYESADNSFKIEG